MTDLYGEDVTISPTMRENSGGATHLHFCGLKVPNVSAVITVNSSCLHRDDWCSIGTAWRRARLKSLAPRSSRRESVTTTPPAVERALARVSARVFFLLPRGVVGAPAASAWRRRGGRARSACGATIGVQRSELRDPDTLLLAGDNGTTEQGSPYLWKWKTDECVSCSAAVLFGWFARSRRTRPPYPTRAGEPVKKIEEIKTSRSHRPKL